MPHPPRTPNEAEVHEARLALDTRQSGNPGMRSSSPDRRILYETPWAFIEMCVPSQRREALGDSWIIGQLIPRKPEQSTGDYRLVVCHPDGREDTVWTTESGEFQLRVDGRDSFHLNCASPDGRQIAFSFTGDDTP